MPEARSALPGARHAGAVTVEEAGLRGMITLKGDLASAALRDVAAGIAGTGFPERRGANCAGERGLLWMAPDEILILVPHGERAGALARIAEALGDAHHLAADVSDARAIFTVAGEGAREVLAKLTPADLRPAALGPGEVRRTRLAQVPAAFWMRDETTAEVICFRSVAQYVFDLLANAAEPGTLPEHF